MTRSTENLFKNATHQQAIKTILKFCFVDILLVQNWWQYGVRFGDQKFDIIYVRKPSITQQVIVLLALQGIRSHLVLLPSVKNVVLPIKITFKRVDLAMLKLTLSCLKNIVVWNTRLSRELTYPVFIDIAFSSSHTYSHWRSTLPEIPAARVGGKQSEPCIKGPNAPG